jgi:hypothetical protein
VGKEKTSFGIHKIILCGKCPFFEKCLASGMKESNENTVKLPEDDPQAFEVAVEVRMPTQ